LEGELVGSIGKAIGQGNLHLFGYFAYVYPFFTLAFIYFVYRYVRSVNFRFIEFCVGLTLMFFTILLIQAAIFGADGGIIGKAGIDSIKPSLGSAGTWVLLLMLFVLSCVLIFEERFFTIVKKSFIIPNSTKAHSSARSNDENTIDLSEINQKPDLNLDNLKVTQMAEFSEVSEISAAEKPKKPARKPKKLKSVAEISNSDEIQIQAETEINANLVSELAENRKLLDEIDVGDFKKPADFKLPPLEFLKNPPKKARMIDENEIDQKIFNLLEKLRQFKIEGDVVRTYSGPVVTTFEFRPAANIKVSKILSLQEDIRLELAAKTIRIQAPVPGKNVVGIEIPNQSVETIYLREILESEIFKNASSPLAIALGKDIVGEPFITDLKKLPHLLVAGTTGSGKSVGINAMLISLLYRNSPKTLRLIMIDPKQLEFSMYDEIPHLLTPVITDSKKAVIALKNLVDEMERRYKNMAQTRTKNIENYNTLMAKNGNETMPYIVAIIDEFADLMMTAGKEVEVCISRLAQKARASGIHLIIATQSPRVDVITGLIKANLPSRLSFKVGSKIDSKVILDQMGADSLLGNGDMLFTPPGTSNLVRLHAPFVSEEEIDQIVEHLKAQQKVIYDENFLAENSEGDGKNVVVDGEELDELYNEAREIVLSSGKTSISYLQRALKIGYNRAANIIEQMEKTGFLTPPNSKNQREINE